MKLGVRTGILDKAWGDGRDDNSRESMAKAISVVSQMGVVGIETFSRHVDAYAQDPEALRSLLAEGKMTLAGAYFLMNDLFEPVRLG